MIVIDPESLAPLHEMIKEEGAEDLKETTEQLIFLWSAYTEWRNFWLGEGLKSKVELLDDMQRMKSYFDKMDHEGMELVDQSFKSLIEVFAAHTLIEQTCSPVSSSVSILLEGLEELFRVIIENPETDNEG